MRPDYLTFDYMSIQRRNRLRAMQRNPTRRADTIMLCLLVVWIVGVVVYLMH